VSVDQGIVFGILAAVLALLAWGRWRHDVVAFAALTLAVLAGVVPAGDAFAGFGHPATVTVALVLVLSRALAGAGATDWIARLVGYVSARTDTHITALAGSGALLSGFMNNVGTLALLMPVALATAAKAARSASLVLMPLSFGTILGGLVTLIGTPPNIIVAAYRGEAFGEPFLMFDFTPVGGIVMLAGVLFVALVGWRLVPRREPAASEEAFELEAYLAELRVPPKAKAIGKTVAEIETVAEQADALIAGIVRRNRRLRLRKDTRVRTRDVLLIEADPEGIDTFMSELELKPVGASARGKARSRLLEAKDTVLTEAVVSPRSAVEGRAADSLNLARRFGVTLLGLSRQGRTYRGRFKDVRLRAGDVLLLHGDAERVPEAVSALECLPLTSRGHSFGRRAGAPYLILIFAGAVAAASLGLVPMPIALAAAVVLTVAFRLMALRDVYQAVDWPVVVLLGALIPVGGALEATGGAALIADAVVSATGAFGPVAVLVLLMVITMTLSDVLNNAATAVVMAPISVDLAERLGANPDAFLMAVAIGASSAFLTPIGHQNNALILGPGGYHFGDYWRMGLPLEALVVAVATPAILLVWPLGS